MKALIVEDEPKVAAFLQQGLEEERWLVRVARDGEEALTILRTTVFDVVVLDIMLPKRDGLSVLRILRREENDVPVLLLTAKDTVPDRVNGLRTGADDYLVKPFAFEELLARLQALTRRKSGHLSDKLQAADLEMDLVHHRVTRAGQPIDLTALEYRLLELLMRNKGHVLSRLDIEELAWDINYDHETNMVDVYINHLRKKIDKPFSRSLICTVRGYGYKIESGNE